MRIAGYRDKLLAIWQSLMLVTVSATVCMHCKTRVGRAHPFVSNMTPITHLIGVLWETKWWALPTFV